MLRMRISSAVSLALLVVVGTIASTAVGATAAPDPSGTAGTAAALHVVSEQADGDRVIKYRVSTPSLAKSATTTLRVNVILPTGYDQDDRRYPVLYALPGTSNLADVWLKNIDTLALTADLPLIIVVPDGTFDADGGGFYTNWVDQKTKYGLANWETFHTAELVPWIDENFRTLNDRDHRAIVGLSQGGFGSLSYAARHPDLYGAVASFSGAASIYQGMLCRIGGPLLVSVIMTGLNGVQPFAPFGDPVRNAANWRAHDPATQLDKLANTEIQLFTSTGAPGKNDLTDPAMLGTVALEAILHQSNICFQQTAKALGIPIGWHSYPVGTHAWEYGTRSLRDYLPLLMDFFDN